MSDKALVSYLVASFNHDKFIVKTLDSILKDGYSPREIIILDDGSTDKTVEVVGRWIAAHSAEQVTFLTRPNRGVTSTLNELVAMSKGDLIRLSSSDDILLPGSTDRLAVELSKNQSIDAVFGDGYVIDDAGQYSGETVLEHFGSSAKEYQADLQSAIISKWAVAGPVFLARRSYLLANPYPPNLTIEDWYMYVRLASEGKIGFSPRPVIEYRIHSANSSKVRLAEMRIRNLSSQAEAASINLPKLDGSLAIMLRAQRSLLRAKIYYLRGRFARGVFSMIFYFCAGRLAHLMRAFRH
jgi:glycosyltransferase involved in cell wall biosynthesis